MYTWHLRRTTTAPANIVCAQSHALWSSTCDSPGMPQEVVAEAVSAADEVVAKAGSTAEEAKAEDASTPDKVLAKAVFTADKVVASTADEGRARGRIHN